MDILAQNSPGLQLKAKSTSLTGRSIFCRGEGFGDLPVKFYKVFNTDVQNMIFQSLEICPNLSELSREEQKAQMWEKRHYPDKCQVPALQLDVTKLFKEKATTMF